MSNLSREQIMELLAMTDDFDLIQIANEYWSDVNKPMRLYHFDDFAKAYKGNFNDFWKLLMRSTFHSEDYFCIYLHGCERYDDCLSSSGSVYELIEYEIYNICDWLIKDERYKYDGTFSQVWYEEWCED